MPATLYLSCPVPHSRGGPEDIPLRRFFPSSGSSFHCEGTLDQEGKTHKLRETHMDQQETLEQLQQLALKRSKPFCYSCYKDAPSGRCTKCGSDDLMRLLPEVGCEYGTDWIIEHILKNEIEPVDMDQAFEDFVRECYPETTKVGWMEFDTVTLMKEMDPVSWRCAQSDWESEQTEEENRFYYSSTGEYYCLSAITDLFDCSRLL